MVKGKISNIQLGLLAVASFYGSTAISTGALGAKRDAWMASILAWLLGIILITITLMISKLNDGKNLCEILESCFGKFFGKVISVLYIFHFLHIASMNIRAFGEFMVTVSYDSIPLWVLMGLLLIIIIYAVRSGLVTLGRISEIFVPILPIPILILSSTILTIHDFSAFKPILVDIGPVIKATGTVVATIFGDFFVFLMILPYTNSEKGRFKAIYIALCVMEAFHLLIVIRETMLIGPGLFDTIFFPAHVAAQMLKVFNMDPFIDTNLLFGGSFKIIIHVYAAVKMTAELFDIEDYKPLVCAFAALTFVMSYWVFSDLLEMRKYLRGTGNILYRMTFQTILPMLVLCISIVKYNATKSDKVVSKIKNTH
jgi:spore germination protein KB